MLPQKFMKKIAPKKAKKITGYIEGGNNEISIHPNTKVIIYTP